MRTTALTINAGIGDMILSHAMLTTAGFDEIEISIDEGALSFYRSESHLGFAYRLATQLFSRKPFRLVPPAGCPGMTPQEVSARYGLSPAVPDLRSSLAISGGHRGDGYIAVTTKIRGWPRCFYEEIRGQFLAAISSFRLPVILIGERRIGATHEYQIHGDSLVYSIYDDLHPLAAADETVPEFGTTPATWSRFVADCTIMRNAAMTVTLGSGGNVSMALACGRRCLAMVSGTEMEGLLSSMPDSDRALLCRTGGDYLSELARWS